MIEVVRFKSEHLNSFTLRPEHLGVLPEGGLLEQCGALSMLHGPVTIAIVGGHVVLPGIAHVWSFLSDDIRKTPLAFHRATKLLLEHQFEVLKLRRMQLSVAVGFMKGWHWARSLGFMCEGVMKSYGPNGEDCWLFARTV